MSNTFAVTKLVEGPRSAYFHVYMRSDGSSGDLENKVVVDPMVDFAPGVGPGMRMSFRKIWYGLAGFDLIFKFDSLVDVPIWVVPAGTNTQELCLDEFGGLQDRSGIDATGKLLVSTTGMTTTADQGSFVIKVNKTFKPFIPA